jgi:hypothetical protein
MRLAVRGNLVALIDTDRPSVSPSEAFAALNRLALRTTGLPLGDLLRRAAPNRPAKPKTKKRKRRSPRICGRRFAKVSRVVRAASERSCAR